MSIATPESVSNCTKNVQEQQKLGSTPAMKTRQKPPTVSNSYQFTITPHHGYVYNVKVNFGLYRFSYKVGIKSSSICICTHG